MNDIELEKERRKRKDILDNFDEIMDRVQAGESVDLKTFVPSGECKKKKNAAIEKHLANKSKI